MLNNFSFLYDIQNSVTKGQKLPYNEINLVGSRLSGKTRSIVELICNLLLINSKANIYVVRKYNVDIRQSVFNEVIDYLSNLNLNLLKYVRVQYNPKYIRFKDTQINFVGMYRQNSNIINLQGLQCPASKYSIVWIEEAYELEQSDQQALLEAVRNYEHITVINSCNPWNIRHWYIDQMNKNFPFNLSNLQQHGEDFGIVDGRLYYYSNYQLNHYLSDSLLKIIERTREVDPIRARVVCDGFYGIEEGTIYAQYMEGCEQKPKRETYAKLIVGLDVGERKDALAVVVSGINQQYNKIQVLEEFYWDFKNQGTRDMMVLANDINQFLKDINYRYKRHEKDILVLCDYNYSFIALLNDIAARQGYNYLDFQGCKKTKIKQRIDFVIAMLSLKNLKINPTCDNLLRELSMSNYDDVRVSAREDGNDHAINAFEYSFIPYITSIKSHNNQIL